MSNHVIKHMTDAKQRMTDLILPTHTTRERKVARMSIWWPDNEKQITVVVDHQSPARVKTLFVKREEKLRNSGMKKSHVSTFSLPLNRLLPFANRPLAAVLALPPNIPAVCNSSLPLVCTCCPVILGPLGDGTCWASWLARKLVLVQHLRCWLC